MTLILLAISFTIALTITAFRFSMYALPCMVGRAAFRYVHAMDAGFLMSGFAALGAAFLSIALVVALLTIAGNSRLRIVILVIFAAPAAVAGYALVYGVAHNAVDSVIALRTLCGAGGLFVGIAAMLNVNAFAAGTSGG
ncbi:hypothetical protein C5748_12615 [Phyllobacterium phragmitis]|uniref:Uncharacterized protein n=1 Tax=Phyllobacterium phragmitis TaxID=2670329 RepID=A0A2S9IR91_9HYPH|nr:hypothetical protein [Phyllobacterium phragmitis]PRD43048.1 hypothetical protein C5748_12615 [Phyllobacterium phragmitis]